jgi:hypothetical protein
MTQIHIRKLSQIHIGHIRKIHTYTFIGILQRFSSCISLPDDDIDEYSAPNFVRAT